MPKTIKKTIIKRKFSIKKPDCNFESIVDSEGNIEIVKHESKAPVGYPQAKEHLVSRTLAFMRSYDVDSFSCETTKEVIQVPAPDAAE